MLQDVRFSKLFGFILRIHLWRCPERAFEKVEVTPGKGRGKLFSQTIRGQQLCSAEFHGTLAPYSKARGLFFPPSVLKDDPFKMLLLLITPFISSALFTTSSAWSSSMDSQNSLQRAFHTLTPPASSAIKQSDWFQDGLKPPETSVLSSCLP